MLLPPFGEAFPLTMRRLLVLQPAKSLSASVSFGYPNFIAFTDKFKTLNSRSRLSTFTTRRRDWLISRRSLSNHQPSQELRRQLVSVVHHHPHAHVKLASAVATIARRAISRVSPVPTRLLAPAAVLLVSVRVLLATAHAPRAPRLPPRK